jgi:Cu(I)/Ag(I) efflux system membrane fusion protein/cobalt-zinc-cadmium efflux system membrane fusion protein
MRTIVIIIASLLIGFASAYFWFEDTDASSTGVMESEEQLYTCGMHPEVVSTEPGVCPICNMNLTPKRDGSSTAGGVVIDPVTRQNMGLTTTPVMKRALSKTVRAFGKVTVAEPNIHNVSLKIPGWIEKLYVNEAGERVFKGQPLLEIYSPELVAAQREYLAAVSNAGNDENLQRLVEMAESRMKNWDIAHDQLDELKETGEISRTVLIRTPVDGFVLAKHVNTGDKVGSNVMLYEIADLSTVWVKAFVYEQDLPYLKLNQSATVKTPGLPGQSFQSRVVYISPALNSQGQVEIRLELDNTNFTLRPEMYTDVELDHRALHERLAVPRSAVINTGARQVVYVASTDDTFEPRIVSTGAADDDDMIEIISGLSGNEKVVTSGQFLLDSESRLGEAIGMMAGHNHGGSMSKDQPAGKHDEHGDSMTMKDTAMDEHEGHDNSHMDHADADADPYDIHTCPMPSHFDVLNYGPGECSKCGMTLVPVSETDNKDVYVCPMPQCGVAQPDSGLCPVCNMKLIKYDAGEEDAE